MGSFDMIFKHARDPGNVVPDALFCYQDLACLIVLSSSLPDKIQPA